MASSEAKLPWGSVGVPIPYPAVPLMATLGKSHKLELHSTAARDGDVPLWIPNYQNQILP